MKRSLPQAPMFHNDLALDYTSSMTNRVTLAFIEAIFQPSPNLMRMAR